MSVKVVENQFWCFSSGVIPVTREGFDKTSKQKIRLGTHTLAQSLSECFGIDRDKIALATTYKDVSGIVASGIVASLH